MTTIPTTRQAIEQFTLADVMTGRGSMPTPFQVFMNAAGTNDPMAALATLVQLAAEDEQLKTLARTHLIHATVYQLRHHHPLADMNVPITHLGLTFHRTEDMLALGNDALDTRLHQTREYLGPKTATYTTSGIEWSADDSFRFWEVPLEIPYWVTNGHHCTLPANILPELWFLGFLTQRIPEARKTMEELRPYLITGWTKLRDRRHPKDRDAAKLGAILVNEEGVEVGRYPLPAKDPYYVEPAKVVTAPPKPSSTLTPLLEGRRHQTHDLANVGRVIVAANATHLRVIHYPLERVIRVAFQVHPESIFQGMSHVGGVTLEKARQMTLTTGRKGYADVALPIPPHGKEDALQLHYQLLDEETVLAGGKLLVDKSYVTESADRMAEQLAFDEQEPHNKNW